MPNVRSYPGEVLLVRLRVEVVEEPWELTEQKMAAVMAAGGRQQTADEVCLPETEGSVQLVTSLKTNHIHPDKIKYMHYYYTAML